MNYLDEMESKSIYIIREANSQFNNPAILWSIGKDSTALLWMCKKAFFGEIPMSVLHIDTGFKFQEIYDFRDEYAKKWNLNLKVYRKEGVEVTHDNGAFECCNTRKTRALKDAVEKFGFDALLLGIRRDEHGIRSKERYFSPRDKDFKWHMVREKSEDEMKEGDSPFVSEQDVEMAGWNIFASDFGEDTDHVRIHPILHWTERDVWEYVKREGIPTPSLYFAKDGKRFRSIGCEPCCKPMDSDADDLDKIIAELKTTHVGERSGRRQDKENQYIMQKLRSLGYM